MQKDVVIQVKNLKKYFEKKNFRGKVLKRVKAVDGISFEVYKGESFGLVGESGCGKSTTAMMLSGIYSKTEGEIIFNGMDVSSIKDPAVKKARKKIQMVFQDPTASIDPRMKIRTTLEEPYRIQKKNVTEEIIDDLLHTVSLDETYKDRYPHELSGGQKQRIGIARALAMDPQVIILDEPTSALDVNVQAQIINLLDEIKNEKKLSYILITHDLSVVKTVCQRVAVMYLGKIMEQGLVEDVFDNPAHPYTKALFSNIPVLDDEKPEKIILEGDVPSPRNIPSGCRFHPRCPKAMERCSQEEPETVEIGDNHFVTCLLFNKSEKKD
ncbi:MAG: ABC transporter ATP-binding protein [Clostridiaceae bacterium]